MSGLDGLQNESRRPDNVRPQIKQKELLPAVLAIRRKYSVYGKDKLKVLLLEERGIDASVSTIGYILKKLVRSGIVASVADVCGTKTSLPRRLFNDHAQRFDFTKPKNPGEMVQIDHMSIDKYKHFAAICQITKMLYSQVYTQATSVNGALFLHEL